MLAHVERHRGELRANVTGVYTPHVMPVTSAEFCALLHNVSIPLTSQQMEGSFSTADLASEQSANMQVSSHTRRLCTIWQLSPSTPPSSRNTNVN